MYGGWCLPEAKSELTQKNNIINFGGWGCCPPGPNDTCPSAPLLPDSKCGSGGPNIMWHAADIDKLPTGAQIKGAGYNGASIDVEGCAEPTSAFADALKKKAADWQSAGIIAILTIPGFGVHGPGAYSATAGGGAGAQSGD